MSVLFLLVVACLLHTSQTTHERYGDGTEHMEATEYKVLAARMLGSY
jgi:hypothetical protein